MRSALVQRLKTPGFRVIPVLLKGGKRRGEENLPPLLSRLQWVDFRASLDDEEAFRCLLAGIRGEVPGPPQKRKSKVTYPSSWVWMLLFIIVLIAWLTFHSLFKLQVPDLRRAESSTTFVLRGEILDAYTAEPLPGVSVQLPEYRQEKNTDRSGQYRFDLRGEKQPRLVKLRATKKGYIQLNLDLAPEANHLNTDRMRRSQ